jgi:hypothetical protein
MLRSWQSRSKVGRIPRCGGIASIPAAPRYPATMSSAPREAVHQGVNERGIEQRMLAAQGAD